MTSAMTAPESPRRTAGVALVCFIAAIASRELARLLPPAAVLPAWKLGWLLFCFAGLWIAHRLGPRGALAELGLSGSAARGLGVALLASLPMPVILFAGQNAATWSTSTFLSSAVLAGFSEEVLFRGYLFRQLHRRAGWSFWAAVVVSALLFGLAHLRSALAGEAANVLGVVGITALGGAFFAWLLVRWHDNLWVPIGIHTFMNAWWDLFAAGPDAVGDWTANGARAGAVIAAVILTLTLAPRGAGATQRRNAGSRGSG